MEPVWPEPGKAGRVFELNLGRMGGRPNLGRMGGRPGLRIEPGKDRIGRMRMDCWLAVGLESCYSAGLGGWI